MEQIQNEQTLENTQAVETEIKEVGESKQEVSLGKFKDVQALLSAYNSLQAEFTKRCQRIKELEGEVKNASLKREITREEKLDIIKEYLDGIKQNNSAVVLTGGEVAKTPIKRPKTVSESR